MIFSSLINNITLIVSLSIFYSFVVRRWRYGSHSNQIISGVLFGAVAVAGMMSPLVISPGLIFDGRSIIISIAGFIGGWATALIAALMGIAYRAWLGGPGAVMGVCVIASSAVIGVAYHYIRRRKPDIVKPLHILGFGIIVHIFMLAMTMTLPSNIRFEVLADIALPVLTVYPIGTMLICLVLLEQESRIRTEGALLMSEEKYRLVVENAREAILIAQEGKIVFLNKAVTELTGFSETELTAHPFINFVHPEDSSIVLDIHLRRMKGEAVPSIYSFRIVNRDGSVKWVETNSTIILWQEQSAVLSFLSDITERRQKQEALHESEAKYRSLFESMMEGYAYCRMLFENGQPRDFIYLDVNPAFATLTGLKNVIGKKVSEVIPGIQKSNPELFEICGRVSLTGQPEKFETYLPSLNIWFSISVFSPVKEFFAAVFKNITERKESEESLRKSEARLIQAQNIAHLGNWEIDLQNQSMWGSDEALRIYGLGMDDLAAPNRLPLAVVQGMVHPDDRQAMDEALMALLKGNKKYDQEFRIFRAGDKSLRWIHSQADIVYSANKLPLKAFGTIQDITERKQVEEALRKSEEKFRLLADNSSDVIWTMDLNGRFTYISPSIKELSGFTPEEAMAIPLEKYIVEEDVPWVMENLQKELQKGREDRIERILTEVRQYKKDGSVLHVEVSTGWLYNDRGEIIGLQGSTRDISARKRMEEAGAKMEAQLRQAQKLEAIGTLAGGIAHDFNNILAVIIGYTEIYKDDVHDRPKVFESMEQVLKAANRAKDLVQQILAFSRQTEQKKWPLALVPLVKEVVKFMRASLPTTIDIRHSLNVKSDVIMADATQIHQMLMNLCTNAGHAMKETGGMLEISLNELTVNSETMQHPSLKDGHYLQLTVRDTGHGIPSDNLERIFDPYYTTKEIGEGTGLGLSVVDGIAKNHGGIVKVYSEIGKGSIFHIYLPKIEEQTKADKITEEILPRGNEKILFVDDEKMLAQVGKIALENLGYTVVTESNPAAAIELFKESMDAFNLVITDKTMPHVTGFDLAREIRGMRANIPIILCTGFEDRDDADKMSAFGINRMIVKPISTHLIARTVREVLDAEKDKTATG